MPQTFQVLRCYKCLVFQVQQVKKSIKWECKLCGVKQSIKRNYGIGTGRDCRIHVQKLNSIRGEIDELKCGQMRRNVENDEEEENLTCEPPSIALDPKPVKDSKWANYIDKEEVSEKSSNEQMCLGDAEVVLELPKKKKRQFHNYSRSNYSVKSPTKSTELSIPQTYNKRKEKEEPAGCNIQKPEHSLTILENKACTISKIEKENCKPNVPVMKFVPPLISKNSKWAQFADEESDVTPSQDFEASQSDLMFSLCDDSELDNVLDL